MLLYLSHIAAHSPGPTLWMQVPNAWGLTCFREDTQDGGGLPQRALMLRPEWVPIPRGMMRACWWSLFCTFGFLEATEKEEMGAWPQVI